MAYNYNIIIEQGSTFIMDIEVQDATGNILDLSGFSAMAQIREEYADTTSITASFACAIDAVNGVITISLTDIQTRDIKFQYGRYDLEITSPTGIVTRVIEGRVQMSKEVTRVV